jgi:hypothetical protein
MSSGAPKCHLAHVPGPERGVRIAVWICEYPYRTMRLAGPSSECADCPVWCEMERARTAEHRADEEVEALEAMITT